MSAPDGIILSVSGLDLTNKEIDFLQNTNPFGFILFSRNFSNIKQLIKLINKLKTVTQNKSVLIFIDQEGGRVQRLRNKEFIKFPPQNVFGNLFLKDECLAKELSYLTSFLLGTELKNVGVDINFSPVCDLSFSYGHSVIGDRSFSEDPIIVKKLSKQYSKGFRDSGILPVLKHFPGHGRSFNDTHLSSSVIETNYNVLSSTDFVPFSILEKESLVMLSHIIYKQIDEKVATFSKTINKMLRERFNFKGLILTDDISMKALAGNLNSIVKKSYDAGCDVILYCNGNINEMNDFYENVRKVKKKYYDFFLNDMLNLTILNHNYEEIKQKLIKEKIIHI